MTNSSTRSDAIFLAMRAADFLIMSMPLLSVSHAMQPAHTIALSFTSTMWTR